MQSIELAKRLKGLQTVKTIEKKLGIKRSTAIKYAHFLKKEGYAKAEGGGKQPRIYRIDTIKNVSVGNPGIYDIINQYSPIKIAPPFEHRIIGRKLTVEEALIRAVNSGDFRTILASLALFNHITDWSRLYFHAKMRNARKKTGALYEIARNIIRVRKMDGRILKKLLNAGEKDKFIVSGLKSKDFRKTEKKWKVFIPFNYQDLERYKE